MAARRVSVNAYRLSDAETAVRTQLRKEGRPYRVVGSEWADFATGQRADDKVAIVVMTTSDGSPVSRSERRTAIVTIEGPAPTNAQEV